jgi:polysaccharide export outer membrane protein
VFKCSDPLIVPELAGQFDVHHGDKVVIPQLTQEVTVVGEVFHPTSQLYARGVGRDEYTAMSGGATRKAVTKHVYVVRAKGGVIANSGSLIGQSIGTWFEWGENTSIRPGDTIVVPLDIDRMRPFASLSNISQIAYQPGIAVAAANAIGVF